MFNISASLDDFIAQDYEIMSNINKMCDSIRSNNLISHDIWAETYRQLDWYLNQQQSHLILHNNVDIRILIMALLRKFTQSSIANILSKHELCGTRHYFIISQSREQSFPIFHQGIEIGNRDSIVCTCRSYFPSTSVLINLPNCCLEAVSSIASKRMVSGSATKLILGSEKKFNRVFAIGREEKRIVISELPLVSDPMCSDVNPLIYFDNSIAAGEEILKWTYINSLYFWDNSKIIRFSSCQYLLSFLYHAEINKQIILH